MAAISTWIAAAGVGATLYTAGKSRIQAAGQSAASLEFQREQSAILEEQKQKYRQITFTNPYADMENPFADFENLYEVNQAQKKKQQIYTNFQ